MKGKHLYLFFLFAFCVLLFLLEYLAPHQFSWKPTFDKKDKEPFGSYVFDDIVSSSIDSYAVWNKTFYQIFEEDSTAAPRAFLLTENNLKFIRTDVEALYRLLHNGNQIMICSHSFPYLLEDTLCFSTPTSNYQATILRSFQFDNTRDSIFFGKDTLHPIQIYEVFPQIHPMYLMPYKRKWISAEDAREIKDKSRIEGTGESMYLHIPLRCDSSEILACDNNNEPIAIRASIGKGELFIVATPYMFTNYGMLDQDNASFTFHLLSYMKDKPLIRIEAYGEHSDQSNTPLRYVLSVPSLKWAIYGAMILLLLFMIFTAKRRQRVIPVVVAPPNRTLGFMQLISNLYYHRNRNEEILKMKQTYFYAEVKRLIGVDLQESQPDMQTYRRLSEKTGIEAEELSTLFKGINLDIYRFSVSDDLLKKYIDGLNHIIKALKS